MYRQGIGGFKYFVGTSSLAQIATREDRVCVLNILGGESSDVTPVGHAYSGGNVVFGTSPGRRGQFLETSLGNVPVYKVTTKLTSEIICRKQKIPHTCVHYRMLDDLSSWVDPNVAALVWTRATPADQLETAVATSLMMGHTPVLLRAFEV